jgi:hypothetical protein
MMMRFLAFVTNIILLLFLASPAWSATYYADTGGSGTTCSVGSPCTLQYAIETKATNGDLVLLNDGTYSEGSSIVIPVGVSVRGTDSVAADVIIQPSTDIANFIVLSSATNTDGNQTLSYFTIDGDNGANDIDGTKPTGIFILNRNNVTLDNLVIKEVYTSTGSYAVRAYSDWGCDTYPNTNCSYNYAKLWSNSTGDGQRWYDFWPAGGDLSTIWPSNGITGLMISNSTFINNGWNDGSSVKGGALGIYNATFSVIDCVFSGAGGGGEGHHRHIHGLGYAEAFWKNPTVSGNTFTGDEWPGKSDYAIEGWLIWGGIFTQNQGTDAQFSIENTDGTTVSENKLVGNLGYGYGIEFSRAKDGSVKYNFLKDHATAIFIGAHKANGNRGTSGTVVESNVIQNSKWQGMLYRYAMNDTHSATIRNNTINGTGLAGIEIEYCSDATACDDSSGSITAVIDDNAISNTAATRYAGVVDDNGLSPTKNLTITNTGFYNNASEACAGTTYNDWNGVTDTGAVCTDVDPFTNSGGDDFTLKSTATSFIDGASATRTILYPDTVWPAGVVTMQGDEIGAFGYEGVAPPTTYYIREGGLANWDATSDCTAANSMDLTEWHANASPSAGEVVQWCNDGGNLTYAASDKVFDPLISGTVGNPITFQNEPGQTVTLDGGGTEPYGIYIGTKDYITIEAVGGGSIVITNLSDPGGDAGAGIRADCYDGSGCLGLIFDGLNITSPVHGMKFFANGGGTAYFDGVTIQNSTIAADSDNDNDYADGINMSEDVNSYTYSMYRNVTIDGNTLTSCGQDCIMVEQGLTLVITDNTMNNTSANENCIDLKQSDTWTVARNSCIGTVQHGMVFHEDGAESVPNNTSANGDVYENHIEDTGNGGAGLNSGIWMQYTDDTKIHHNWIEDIYASGIWMADNESSANNNEITYNVIVNTNTDNVGGAAGIECDDCVNPKIYGNTIYNVGTDGDGITIYGNTNTIGVTIKNNIIHTAARDLIRFAAGTTTSADVDYNQYYPDGAGQFTWNGAASDNFADWVSDSGNMDANGAVGDPLFTAVGGDDFTLATGSPCINTGVDLGSSYDDTLDPNSTWPSGVATLYQGELWEMGAFGYEGVAPPTTTTLLPPLLLHIME